MARFAVNRNSVTRDKLHQQSYNSVLYYDSFGDPVSGYVGESLFTQTSQLTSLDEQAVAGEPLGDIATRFLAAFSSLSDSINTIILGGGINNIADAVERTSLAVMKTDMASMADPVIADGRYNLFIINIAPWGGHAEWTSALQEQTEDYNAWLLATYPDNVINVYNRMGDVVTPNLTQLSDDFIHATLLRTNLNPNKNGSKIIDEMIGTKLFNRGAVDLAEPTGNYIPTNKYRDFDLWTPNVNSVIGGVSPILCADNTFATNKGCISLFNTAKIKSIAMNSDSIVAATDIIITMYLRAGFNDWAYVRNVDAAGSAYINLLTAEVEPGGAAWTAERAGNGWIKCQLEATKVGTGANYLEIRSANDAVDTSTVGSIYAPEFYIDAVSIVDA